MTPTETSTAKPGQGPLAGVRVIDLTTVLMGPSATQLMADYGAEVIKVEAPGGDIFRDWAKAPQPGMSSFFQHINRNKASIVLDLRQQEARDALLKLVAGADAFVVNMRPAALARLGLDAVSLAKVNPRLVHFSFVGFGTGGPYAGRAAYDDVVQGMSGIADLLSRANGGEPRYAPMGLADRVVGLYGASMLAMALFQQKATGRGAVVEVPMFEVLSSFVLTEHLYGASFAPPVSKAVNPRAVDKNRRPYPTSDGYICLLPYNNRHWIDLFTLIGRTDLHEDPRFNSFSNRSANIGALYDIVGQALKARTSAEWLRACEEVDIPAMPMHSIESLIDDPHLAAVGLFRPTPRPEGYDFIHITPAMKVEGYAPELRHAPRLGEDTRAVLRGAGYTESEIDRLVAAGAAKDETAKDN